MFPWGLRLAPRPLWASGLGSGHPPPTPAWAEGETEAAGGSREGPSKSPALGGDALGTTRAQEGPRPWLRLVHLFPLSIAPQPAPSLHWALRHPLPSARPGAGGRVWAQCGGAQCFPQGPSSWWKQGSPTPSSCYSRRDQVGKDTLPREAGCLTRETDGGTGPAPGWGQGRWGSPVTAGCWGEEGKAGPGGLAGVFLPNTPACLGSGEGMAWSLRSLLPVQGTQVRSPVGELRSHVPRSS